MRRDPCNDHAAGLPGLERLDRDAILERIKRPCGLHVFDSIDSTNSYLKRVGAGALPLCAAADEQTAGRGRLGRSFHSPNGSGIYVSAAAVRPLDPAHVPVLTMGAAVSAARAIEEIAGASPSIKWVNDLYLNDLKVSGILTEAVASGGAGVPGGSLIVIGVGINCFPFDLPEDLRGIAGYVSDIPGSFSRSALAGAVLDGLLGLLEDPGSSAFMDEYRERCFIIGRDVLLDRFDGKTPVKAHVLGVASDGALIARYLEGPLAGTEGRVTSGEVSLRAIPQAPVFPR